MKLKIPFHELIPLGGENTNDDKLEHQNSTTARPTRNLTLTLNARIHKHIRLTPQTQQSNAEIPKHRKHTSKSAKQAPFPHPQTPKHSTHRHASRETHKRTTETPQTEKLSTTNIPAK